MKTITKTEKLNAYKLTTEDVDQLVGMLDPEFSEKRYYHSVISFDLKGDSYSYEKASDISESHKNLGKIQGIYISFSDIRRSVCLSDDLKVQSDNEAWAAGVAHLVKKFIEERRAPHWWVKKIPFVELSLIPMLALFAAMVAVLEFDFPIKDLEYPIRIALALIVMLFLLASLSSRLPESELILWGSESWFHRNMNPINISIAFASFIVGLIALIK